MTDLSQVYATAIASAISGLFRSEEDDGNSLYHYDLDTLDATKFFTGFVVAGTVLFNQLTDDNKSGLDFTYICNRLMVQLMMQNNGQGGEKIGA